MLEDATWTTISPGPGIQGLQHPTAPEISHISFFVTGQGISMIPWVVLYPLIFVLLLIGNLNILIPSDTDET